MEWGTFEKFLNDLKELPFLETVHFGGFGEPFGHQRILDILKAVKNLGLRVEIITIYGREKETIPCYLGNINEKTLKEIWTKKGYINFWRSVKNF